MIFVGDLRSLGCWEILHGSIFEEEALSIQEDSKRDVLNGIWVLKNEKQICDS